MAAMTTELLRRVAALIREGAEAATPSPWEAEWADEGFGAVWHTEADGQPDLVAHRTGLTNGHHIASWHPLVALAVADLLDHVAVIAQAGELYGEAGDTEVARRALVVARAYLGEAP